MRGGSPLRAGSPMRGKSPMRGGSPMRTLADKLTPASGARHGMMSGAMANESRPRLLGGMAKRAVSIVDVWLPDHC